MSVAIEEIQTLLREMLADHPAGLSEYDLLKGLAEREVGFFDEVYFHSPIGLFQRHFLLFHCLYSLRVHLRASGQDMQIHCLSIRVAADCGRSSDHPAPHDPLADYYLDLDNLEATDESDVLRMLDDFWLGFSGEGQRDEALAVMELTHPVSFTDIKQQYRRLAMQHHPDRGGDAEQFHRLEWAMGILRSVYQ